MRIAIGLRTCGSVYNYWNQPRIVDASKPTLLLTCLNSLLRSVTASQHEIIIGVHDDATPPQLWDQMDRLFNQYGIRYERYDCEKMGNFRSQYEWIKRQDCDYAYHVEDDYLHRTSALDDMVDLCEDMKRFHPGEYAVFPMNHPHRYVTFESLNLCYLVKGKRDYWRSIFHSTATFFMSKQAVMENDAILKYQAYTWEIDGAREDKTINLIWNSQKVRLLSPINSLAWHISDESNRDTLGDWQSVWLDNLTEAS